MKPNLYACGYTAKRSTRLGIELHHSVCIVEANSADEATGKGMRVATKFYPNSAGFHDHYVVACPNTCMMDPDLPITPYSG